MTTTATSISVSTPRTAIVSGAHRQLSWDLLRVFAIFSVVVQHITYEALELHPEIGEYPFQWSYFFGADSMLLISGYFVCVTLSRRPAGRWWWNRVARLIPPYLVAVVFTGLALYLFAPAGGWFVPSLLDLLGNLLLLESFFPDTVRYVDPSYWTLTAQLFAFTAAAVLARRIRWRSRRWALPTLCWGLTVVPPFVGLWADKWAPLGAFYAGVAMNRWQLFGMGVAIWLRTQARIRLAHLALLLAVGLFAVYYPGTMLHAQESILLLGAVTLAMVITAARPDWAAPLARFLGRPVAFLAGVSYGVYLLNQMLGYLFASKLTAIGVGALPRLLAVVGAAIVLGWLLTRFVERPAHRALMSLLPAAHRANIRARGWLSRWPHALRLEWSLGHAGPSAHLVLGASRRRDRVATARTPRRA